MNRIRRIMVVAALAMAALLLVTANAMAAVVLNFAVPVSGTVFNPCNGETITFSGIDHVTVQVTVDGAGGFHANTHDNIHVTGSGSLGNSYEGNQQDNSPFNGKIGVEQTFGLTFSEIGQGSGPNFEVHMLQHITINPNGTVTVFVDNFTSNCRG